MKKSSKKQKVKNVYSATTNAAVLGGGRTICWLKLFIIMLVRVAVPHLKLTKTSLRSIAPGSAIWTTEKVAWYERLHSQNYVVQVYYPHFKRMVQNAFDLQIGIQKSMPCNSKRFPYRCVQYFPDDWLKGTSKNIQPPIGTNLSQHILAKTPCYTSVWLRRFDNNLL